MVPGLDILPKAPPEELTESTQNELAAIRQQLEQEQASQPIAGIALSRLKSVTSRTQLVREIQSIQDEREFSSMNEQLRSRLALLQKSVETLPEQGSRIIEQTVVQPTNEAIQQLPGWARLSVLGIGVGSTLYTGYKVGGAVLKGIGNFLKKTWKVAATAVTGAAIAGLGFLGYKHFIEKKNAPAESTEAAPA
jgi:hypothetical protein